MKTLTTSQKIFLAFSFPATFLFLYFLFKKDEEEEDDSDVPIKTSRLRIPHESIGIVLGLQGVQLEAIRGKTGTRMSFQDSDINSDKVLLISGTADGVREAESIVRNLLKKHLPVVTETIYIPRYAIKIVQGINKENIRSMSRTSKAKIILNRNEARREEQQFVEVELQGTSTSILTAKKLIMDAVKQNDMKSLSRQEMSQTDDDALCFVTAVEHPGHFWIQQIDCTSDPFDSLIKEMNEYYNSETKYEKNDNEMGDLVASKLSCDGNWYRAEVKDVVSGDLVLYFVDFGDTEIVNQKAVRHLSPQFLSLPFQAIECCLANIKPLGHQWPELATKEFERLTNVGKWKPLKFKIVGQNCDFQNILMSVILLDESPLKDLNIADQLVSDGFAQYHEGASEVSNNLQKMIANEDKESQIKDGTYFSKVNVTSKNCTKMTLEQSLPIVGECDDYLDTSENIDTELFYHRYFDTTHSSKTCPNDIKIISSNCDYGAMTFRPHIKRNDNEAVITLLENHMDNQLETSIFMEVTDDRLEIIERNTLTNIFENYPSTLQLIMYAKLSKEFSKINSNSNYTPYPSIDQLMYINYGYQSYNKETCTKLNNTTDTSSSQNVYQILKLDSPVKESNKTVTKTMNVQDENGDVKDGKDLNQSKTMKNLPIYENENISMELRDGLQVLHQLESGLKGAHMEDVDALVNFIEGGTRKVRERIEKSRSRSRESKKKTAVKEETSEKILPYSFSKMMMHHVALHPEYVGSEITEDTDDTGFTVVERRKRKISFHGEDVKDEPHHHSSDQNDLTDVAERAETSLAVHSMTMELDSSTVKDARVENIENELIKKEVVSTDQCEHLKETDGADGRQVENVSCSPEKTILLDGGEAEQLNETSGTLILDCKVEQLNFETCRYVDDNLKQSQDKRYISWNDSLNTSFHSEKCGLTDFCSASKSIDNLKEFKTKCKCFLNLPHMAFDVDSENISFNSSDVSSSSLSLLDENLSLLLQLHRAYYQQCPSMKESISSDFTSFSPVDIPCTDQSVLSLSRTSHVISFDHCAYDFPSDLFCMSPFIERPEYFVKHANPSLNILSFDDILSSDIKVTSTSSISHTCEISLKERIMNPSATCSVECFDDSKFTSWEHYSKNYETLPLTEKLPNVEMHSSRFMTKESNMQDIPLSFELSLNTDSCSEALIRKNNSLDFRCLEEYNSKETLRKSKKKKSNKLVCSSQNLNLQNILDPEKNKEMNCLFECATIKADSSQVTERCSSIKKDLNSNSCTLREDICKQKSEVLLKTKSQKKRNKRQESLKHSDDSHAPTLSPNAKSNLVLAKEHKISKLDNEVLHGVHGTFQKSIQQGKKSISLPQTSSSNEEVITRKRLKENKIRMALRKLAQEDPISRNEKLEMVADKGEFSQKQK